jgi:type III restriction enzyme
MNEQANFISQRLSLREPLKESLAILVKLADELSLQKEVNLSAELAKVEALFPTCTDFEREFPSIAFSIATGVGKTRLMGAFITYLHLKKGIRNFFILAPGSTIYEKLIEDFGNPGFHKYVFKGIAEFVHNRPLIITGDNYNQQGQLFSDEEIRINIFNIQKFNSETKAPKAGKEKGKPPKIKRLSEHLGQSYWSYLSQVEDLVILMDEAHRYHGDSSKTALNELKPILGLELTATPITQKGASFKNVVYEYSLAHALDDGKYVKIPAIATRRNFDAKNLSDKEIDVIKLEDAISLHEDTKNELQIFAANNGKEVVKPFILVVCRDISHAEETYELLNSGSFFEGNYAGKVLQIDSSTKKEEEVERLFLGLEDADNEIEIVIHVNMLKEGWDVTNLYTIVPLRAANASILIEQTIGRGLRLPFGGRRTGEEKIDKLTVLAHENFEGVIAAAKNPDSILNKMSFIEIEKADSEKLAEVIQAKTKTEANFEKEAKEIESIKEPEQKQKAQNVLDAKKAIIDAWEGFNKLPEVRKTEDLAKPEVKRKAIRKLTENLEQGQGNLFKNEIVAEAEATYDKMVEDFKKNTINIPRMSLVLGSTTVWFSEFDLDTTDLSYAALDQEIIRMNARGDGPVDTIAAIYSGFQNENPINTIVNEVVNYNEIDYDDNAALLNKLATQAYTALQEKLGTEAELKQVIIQFKRAIAEKIYLQMMAHFNVEQQEYNEPNVLPFTRIETWNFSALKNNGYKDYRDSIQPISDIPKYVFRGFEKACHFEYKFDSKAEQDLAYILEIDKVVEKWLRPAPNQFRMYWDKNSKKYEPDFVVETVDSIYMVEVKRADHLEEDTVLQKMEAALKFCGHANTFIEQENGKTWNYLLLPHDQIKRSTSWAYLVANYIR